MTTIRVGVQATSSSAGQVVDFDAGSVSLSSIVNQSGVAVQYSTNGTDWTSIAAGATASPGATVDTTLFRLRLGAPGAYPAPIDLTFEAISASAVPGAGKILDRANRILFDGSALSAWTAVTTGGSIVESRDTSGAYGPFLGRTITLTNAGGGGATTLTSPYIPLSSKPNWFFSAEFGMGTNWATIEVRDEVSSNLLYVQLGLPANQIRLDSFGGSAVNVTPSGFDQNSRFRILVHFKQLTVTTGEIRCFLYHESGYVRTHSQLWSGNVIASRIRVTQQNNASNTMTLERFIAAEGAAVVNGCSVDAGYAGFLMAPTIPRAAVQYNVYGNPANMLASLINGADREHGSNDWFINHAVGGYRVDQMKADFQQWVLDLAPRFVVIGSPTNSILAAMSQGSPTAYMTTAKADYLSMISSARAIGAKVLCMGPAPRHDSTTVSLGQALHNSLAADWRAWASAAVPAADALFADVWTPLEKPGVAGNLADFANAGDNVHWTQAGKQAVVNAAYALLA